MTGMTARFGAPAGAHGGAPERMTRVLLEGYQLLDDAVRADVATRLGAVLPLLVDAAGASGWSATCLDAVGAPTGGMVRGERPRVSCISAATGELTPPDLLASTGFHRAARGRDTSAPAVSLLAVGGHACDAEPWVVEIYGDGQTQDLEPWRPVAFALVMAALSFPRTARPGRGKRRLASVPKTDDAHGAGQ